MQLCTQNIKYAIRDIPKNCNYLTALQTAKIITQIDNTAHLKVRSIGQNLWKQRVLLPSSKVYFWSFVKYKWGPIHSIIFARKQSSLQLVSPQQPTSEQSMGKLEDS